MVLFTQSTLLEGTMCGYHQTRSLGTYSRKKPQFILTGLTFQLFLMTTEPVHSICHSSARMVGTCLLVLALCCKLKTLDAWSRQRKYASHIMRQSEKANFFDYPELESIRMLMELMSHPSKYHVALESYISRITCRLAWGTSEASDELKQRARELLVCVSPTGHLGNKLSFIMNLPDWLSPAKAWERRRAKTERRFFEIMQNQVRSELAEKQTSPSWMSMFYNSSISWGFSNETEAAYAVGMHGIAGALTIAAPMQSFCLAMCNYPQYLSMLHKELDLACGDRMPQSSDVPNLPVLRAIIRECLRWRPPVPTGKCSKSFDWG